MNGGAGWPQARREPCRGDVELEAAYVDGRALLRRQAAVRRAERRQLTAELVACLALAAVVLLALYVIGGGARGA